ncbi:hypothetical protein BDZ89DRAFT_1031767 [Hymenopellis radicata]|nr:hypothetical protein BDZ89DRAFT_1031767 [Hymenopellis radicata]
MANAHFTLPSPPSRTVTPGYEYSTDSSINWPTRTQSPSDTQVPNSPISRYYTASHPVDSTARLPNSPEIGLSNSVAPRYGSTPSPTPPAFSPTSPYEQPYTPIRCLPESIPTPAVSPDTYSHRIPRPPNAFMLFRSDCIARIRAQLKERGGEKRQQIFSRVAGEAWHLLKPEERLVWQEKAASALAAHQAKYPGYKFAPVAKGSSRKGKNPVAAEAEELSVADIRAKYLGLPGLAVKNPAPKRRRRTRKVHSPNEAPSNPFPTPAPSTTSPVPPYMPVPPVDPPPLTSAYPLELASPFGCTSLPYSSPSSDIGASDHLYGPPQADSNLPTFFPNPSVPHYLGQAQLDVPIASPEARHSTASPIVALPASNSTVYRCDNDLLSSQLSNQLSYFDNTFVGEFMYSYMEYDYSHMATSFVNDGFSHYTAAVHDVRSAG